MFRKSQDINDICQEREQMLSQLRHSKRMNMLNEKRNNIKLYDSLNEVFSTHPDLKILECYLSDCLDLIKSYWEESIGCVFMLKNDHFLMTNVDEFEKIANVMSDFDNYKCMVIYARHKYIYIDNQSDLHYLIENNSVIFKWWDNSKKLIDQTHGEIMHYFPCDDEFDVRPWWRFYTNILEEAFNYINQNYECHIIPTLLELRAIDGYYNYNSYENDNKKYEVINEIDLLNQNIITLKNNIDLNQRRYVGAFIIIDPDIAPDSDDAKCIDYAVHRLRLIQIDNLEQLEYLKQFIDCDPCIYKTI